MAGLYSSDFLDNLRNRAVLSQLFSQKTTIKRHSRDVFAICPFHQEKTPSCKVDDGKGFFYCFGCGASGDAIDFVRKTENLSFQEAVEKLALQFGLDLPAAQKSKDDLHLKSAYALNEHAAEWYRSNLRSEAGKRAVEYLLYRGVSDALMDKFRLGYAPMPREATYAHLKLLGFDTKTQQDFGPINQGLKDRFSGRIIFPIEDGKGRVVGFGGRVFENEEQSSAKYINSQESIIFHKKKLLYNFYNVRQMQQDLPLIICEGYMDVLALSKINIGRVVAPLGTAISEEQIISCWKVCRKPIVMLDGDNAGIKAMERLIERIIPYLRSEYSLGFCVLPKNEDPDSLVSSGKSNVITKLVKEPKNILEMIWLTYISRIKKHTPESAADLRHNLRDVVNKIVDVDLRQTYGGVLATLFKDYTNNVARNAFRPFKNSYLNVGKKLKQQDSIKLAAKILVATILNHPHMLSRVEKQFLELISKNPDLHSLGDSILCLCQSGACSSEQMYEGLVSRGHNLDWIGERLYRHAGFARESSKVDEAYEGWINVWETSFVKKSINDEAKHLANKLKVSFCEFDWTRLKALKSSSFENIKED
ncbi:MAG: DNA primase [Holosporales bacterium]|jgi:DNA primase|nr:DNA primase [Holosporales bacterium]